MNLIVEKKKDILFISGFSADLTYKQYEHSEIKEVIEIYNNDPASIVLDFDDVHHIDSLCIGQLSFFVKEMKKTSDHSISIINVGIGIQKTFDILSMDKIINYTLKN